MMCAIFKNLVSAFVIIIKTKRNTVIHIFNCAPHSLVSAWSVICKRKVKHATFNPPVLFENPNQKLIF